MPSSYAVRAADFLSTLGVDTHINYTDGQYVDINRDLSALQYLGINRVRDAAPNPNFDSVGQRHLDTAANSGLLFTFYADDPNPSLVASRIHNFAVAHPGSVAGIEGPNEVNNWPVSYNGLSGTAGAQGYQQALYNLLKSDSVTKNIPVLGFTDYPVHASASDQNNIHPYAKNGDQPRATIEAGASDQNRVDPGKPFSITETGYHTSLTADTNGGWEGVDEITQAKLILNTYMDAADLGSKSTFVYQLLDAYPDTAGTNQESHFGLFKLDYTPKLAAVAIHNLTAILGDGGSNAQSYTTGSLNYSVSGLPQTGHTYLTQKSNGSYQVTIWNEPDVWNEATDQAISDPTNKTTVSLGSKFGTIEVFDPLKSTSAITIFHNVSSIDIDLTDHPLIVQVTGALASGSTETLTAGTSNSTVTPSTSTVPSISGTQTSALGGSTASLTQSTSVTSTSAETKPDVSATIDLHGSLAQAYRLYQAALDRAPDSGGLSAHTDALQHGLSIHDDALSFINSVEFGVKFGTNTSDQAFVTALYNNVLDRAPDAVGNANWLNALTNHTLDRASVLVGFSESLENHANIDPAITAGIHFDYGLFS